MSTADKKSLRDEFEAWADTVWAPYLPREYHEDAWEYVDVNAQDCWQAFQAAHNAQQAIIDRLVLEYCPSEMTAEQVATWGNSQRRAVE